MKLAIRITIVLLCVAIPAVPLSAWLLWMSAAPDVDPRVKLDGETVGENARRLDRWVAERTAQKLASTVVLKSTDGEVTVSLQDLGFVPETDRTMKNLRALTLQSRRGDPLACYDAWGALRRGEVEADLVISLVPDVLVEYLLDLKDDADVGPIQARIDFDAGEVKEHESGSALEIYTAAALIEKAVLVDGVSQVQLPMVAVEPSITADDLASFEDHVVISEFSTTFPRAGKNASRAHNVAHAASRLDGAILLPGRILSFNATVGERSLQAGFQEAPEIYEGEMVEGVGGGTCQVSSTLHAAAMMAGLEIIERYPHSRPSSYIRMGLDATVAYPTVDLRIRNPYPMPVVIRAFTEKGRLTVQLMGPVKPAEVKFRTKIVRKDPFEEVIEEDVTMQVGIVLVKQYGLPGYLLKRVRTMEYTDGTEKVETTKDYYPPTKHLVVVHPDTGYTGLSADQRGVEAEEADEGELQGEQLEERPADFAAPEASDTPPEPAWTIVNGPFAHPPKPN